MTAFKANGFLQSAKSKTEGILLHVPIICVNYLVGMFIVHQQIFYRSVYFIQKLLISYHDIPNSLYIVFQESLFFWLTILL